MKDRLAYPVYISHFSIF